MSNMELWKAIWEIRFPSAARLFDSRGYIAAKWQDPSELTEWRVSNDQVIVHNKSGRTHLRAEYRALGVVTEKPDSFAAFRDLAIGFSDDTLRRLGVRAINRIGLRLIYFAEREDFGALVARMRQQLYRLTDDDWALLGSPPIDVALPLTLEFDEGRANFNLGPMGKEQLSGFFSSDEVKGQLPLVALFLDFDLYKVNPGIQHTAYRNELKRFMDDGEQLIRDSSTRFIERFGGFE